MEPNTDPKKVPRMLDFLATDILLAFCPGTLVDSGVPKMETNNYIFSDLFGIHFRITFFTMLDFIFDYFQELFCCFFTLEHDFLEATFYMTSHANSQFFGGEACKKRSERQSDGSPKTDPAKDTKK